MPALAPFDVGCAVCDELAEAVISGMMRSSSINWMNLSWLSQRMCWRRSPVFIAHLLRSSPVSLTNTSLNPFIPKNFTFRSTGKECSWKTQEAMNQLFFVEKSGVKGKEQYNFYVPDKLAQELRKNGTDSDLFILQDDGL